MPSHLSPSAAILGRFVMKSGIAAALSALHAVLETGGRPRGDILVRLHSEVHGAPPPTRMSPSVCDAGWLAGRGIPVAVYGPGGWEQAHAVDEAVATEDLLACARVYARVIDEWCGR